MQTDLSRNNEFATITVTPSGRTPGAPWGTCNGGNDCAVCCRWFDCTPQLFTLVTSDFGSTDYTSMEVKLEYSLPVSSSPWAKCTDNITGKSGAGVARITLTPVGTDIEIIFLIGYRIKG